MLIPGHSKSWKISIIILVLAIIFAGIYFYPSHVKSPQEIFINKPAQYFIEQAENRIVVEQGPKTSGFTKEMFMNTFPNLTDSDFTGVEVKQDEAPIASSKMDFYLTKNGEIMLLENVSKRSGLPIETIEDIDEIISFLVQGKEIKYERVDVTGEYTCLPKKNTDGPITLECALGIKSTTGEYYGLNLAVLETHEGMNLQTGQKIKINGTLVPVSEEVSSANWDTYDIGGIIWVTSLKKL